MTTEPPGGGREDWSVLMAAAQAGDRAAYRRLLAQVVPVLRAQALQALGDRAEAEDAVQDVLLTLHAMRQAYDPTRPFTPWLFGIARHRIADRRRLRRRRTSREEPIAESHVTIPEQPTNREEVTLDAGALGRAMAALPPGQRVAIELLKLQEKSLAEAADLSGMSVGALKVATHRAMARLRALLGDRE